MSGRQTHKSVRKNIANIFEVVYCTSNHKLVFVFGELGSQGGRGTVIFSHIRRLETFFGVQKMSKDALTRAFWHNYLKCDRRCSPTRCEHSNT